MLSTVPGMLVTPWPYHGAVVSLYATLDLDHEVGVAGHDDVMLVLATGRAREPAGRPHVLVITPAGTMGWCWVGEARWLVDADA